MAKFINPYNFIPMASLKGKADEAERTFTGVIDYSVLTKSPLFIPNTSNEKTFKQSYEFVPKGGKENQIHKSYDFYSYHNLCDDRQDTSKPQTWENRYFRPMIPGSEIRGMFRSNFEILTNSCMSVLDTDEKLSKRTMERFKAGLIYKRKDGKFDLCKAEDVLWRTKGENDTQDELDWKKEYYNRKCYIQKNFPEGCHVSYKKINRGERIKPLARDVEEWKEKAKQEKDDGYIIKGEAGPEQKPNKKTGLSSQKHCCHIFRLLDGKRWKTDISVEGLEALLLEYKKNGESSYDEYSKEFKDFRTGEENKYFPVYYSIVNSQLFLSPACITREIYDHTLADLAKDMKPCENKNKLCPACSLFGTVMQDAAVASRIRFSDLEGEVREDYKECYEPIVTLPPLSSPKLNNMEFYLKRPSGAWFWTYDYYVDEKGDVVSSQGELAGRKFYWHNIKNLDSLRKDWGYDGEINQLNMTVRPVIPGYTFKGKLYFKKLTKKELDSLIYLLNAGDVEDIEKKEHGYKLGAAKPLGFGSVACSIDNINLIDYQKENHTIQRNDREYTLEMSPSMIEIDSKIEENFKSMTDFKTIPKGNRICYPYVDGKRDEGYAWFVENHGGYNRNKQREEPMPASRRNMLFCEYMQAMVPELKQTYAGKKKN